VSRHSQIIPPATFKSSLRDLRTVERMPERDGEEREEGAEGELTGVAAKSCDHQQGDHKFCAPD